MLEDGSSQHGLETLDLLDENTEVKLWLIEVQSDILFLYGTEYRGNSFLFLQYLVNLKGMLELTDICWVFIYIINCIVSQSGIYWKSVYTFPLVDMLPGRPPDITFGNS